LLKLFAEHASALSIGEIGEHFDVSNSTLRRDLRQLVDDGEIIAVGENRGRRYMLRNTPQTKIERQPSTWRAEWLRGYRPNRDSYLRIEELAILEEIGSPTSKLPAGTYARRILDRLLIDLTWNSSRLEGSTVSLLDTEELIVRGKDPGTYSATEIQMVLNHKAAIEYLVEEATNLAVTPIVLRNLHALLSENLLADPADEGGLRRRPVEISGSAYIPVAHPPTIVEGFELICEKAESIENPFEQAFFLLVHIPYLQPFVDVNKRVSRLAANIPFIKLNYYPISFLDVDRDDYLHAMLDVYEVNDVARLRRLFVDGYRRSAQKYAVIAQSIGEPDPLRLELRAELKTVVAHVVREHVDESEVPDVIDSLGLNVPEELCADFERIVREELAALHEGNFARYRLRPSEFESWRNQMR
jgi:Fic family protein